MAATAATGTGAGTTPVAFPAPHIIVDAVAAVAIATKTISRALRVSTMSRRY